MGYYPDLKSIDLKEYAEIIKNKILIPSRQTLKENIDKIMLDFIILGFKNIDELLKVLKNKKKFEELLNKELFYEKDLINLKREISAMHPKANKFSDFKFLDKELIDNLIRAGYKNTKELYTRVINTDKREKLSLDLGIKREDIEMLTSLCDISRIQWVNHTFAYVLYEAGYKSLESVKKADPETLYGDIVTLNRERNLYKGHIGLNDMKILIEASKIVPSEILY